MAKHLLSWHWPLLLAILFAFAQLLLADLPATQEPPKFSSHSPVGVATKISQIVIAGPELEAKPIEDRKTPIVVRVLATFRHGTDFRYDLEYYGLDPGHYDLRDYLQRNDRSSMESAQPLMVNIESHLPPGQILPSNLSTTKLPNMGGYRTWMGAVIGAWILAVLWLILAGRQAKIIPSNEEHIQTPAEQLRPLVNDAIAGRLSPAGQAQLERVLLLYWRQRLDLEEADPVTALANLRKHPEAGKLLRLIEDWLHRPGGAGKVDVAAILAPYQHLEGEEEAELTPSPVNMPARVGLRDRFTDQARKIMQLANQEAQRLNHEYIGTEHILLGFIKIDSGVGLIVLKNLGIDLRTVRLEVEKLVQAGPEMATKGKLSLVPRAKKAIEYALEEAHNLNHSYVGSEHLLLGLLREQEGVAGHVLMNLGLRFETARDELMRLLGHSPVPSSSASQGT